jgi:hypothetical protein
MACGSPWDREGKVPEHIAGDRRSDKRYSILLGLRWKLIHRRRVVDAGTGTTLDLSKGGVRFESDRPLPEGLNVELAIAWPVLLRDVAPLQLVVQGRIVRSKGGQIAMRMVQHEFRTVGMPASVSSEPSKTARSGAPFLAAVNRTAVLARVT